MASFPLSFLAGAKPSAPARRAEPVLAGKPEPLARPRVLAATSGQRRWTVVIPHRLTARAAHARAQAEAVQSALPPPRPAIRFRPQLTMFGMIAAVAAGLYVYTEKHGAAAVESQIAHAFQATQAAQRQAVLLRAEWALLNDPDRLHPLADRYLALEPTRAAQFVRLTDLHRRLPAILYGPPPPEPADDEAAPPAPAKRLLALATAADMPAEPQGTAGSASDQSAATPVIAPPADAIRVLAREAPAAQASPAPDADQQQNGLVENDLPKADQPQDDQAQAEPPRDDPPRDDPPRDNPPRPATPKPAHPAAPALTAAHLTARPAFPPAVVPAPKLSAPRLLAHAEPRLHTAHQPTSLSAELVHMLMMPHAAAASSWPYRPRTAFAPTPMPHHVEYGRSEPAHFLSAPPQERSDSTLQVPAEKPHANNWGNGSPYYHAAPAYTYRQPYWAYNANPYGGRSLPPPVPMYPGYQ